MRHAPLLFFICFGLAACGTTGSADPPAAATPTVTVGTDDASEDAIADQLSELARRKEAAVRAGDTQTADQLEQAMRDIERAEMNAIEAETADPYNSAIDQLPLKEPPLHVQQFELDDSHELVVRTDRKRFLCATSADQRLAAIEAYYELADKAMRDRGIDDFELIVDTASETGQMRPLAKAGPKGVRLTARGRRPC